MKIIQQSHEILTYPDYPDKIAAMIELAGRTCYKSEDKITGDSAQKFALMLLNRGHEAMIEFGDATVKFITNRGVTHELVRHRLCSFAQESTRYVNYGSQDIAFIKPVWCDIECGIYNETSVIMEDVSDSIFAQLCLVAERRYKDLLTQGWRPEQAREVLPNALKTEIVVKANIREWRHILQLRCSTKAHPQMRALMLPVLKEFNQSMYPLFTDLYTKYLGENQNG